METQKAPKRYKHCKDQSSEASPRLVEEIIINETKSTDLKGESLETKRTRLSYEDKKSILQQLQSCSEEIIRQKYGISGRTLRKWKEEREKIMERCNPGAKKSKTLRSINELDDRVFIFLLDLNKNGTPATGFMLRQEALKINKELGGPENFCASEGWLDKWKKRKGVRSLQITGEKLSADATAAKRYKEVFKQIVATKELHRALVFNMDESSLPFKEIPKRTLVPKTSSCISGMKKQQERLTVAACCNADGSFQLPIILIGKSKNPRCLHNIDKTKLPVWYRHQKSAWMDKSIFEEWFTDEFVPRVKAFLKSKNLPSRVVLLVDNCKSHKFLKIDDIEVTFLPPNVTSLLQPLDQGILQTLKLNYQKSLVESILRAQEKGISMIDHLKAINIKTVIEWVAEAWKKVEPYTMYKSWNKIWPAVNKDAETQTEVNSFPVLMSLDDSVGRESVNAPLTIDDDEICDLLKSLRKVDGYDSVDRTTMWEWLANPKGEEYWSDDEIENQVNETYCSEPANSKEEFIFVEEQVVNLNNNNDFDGLISSSYKTLYDLS